MIKKDLLHLNTWWYRLFKVLYIFIFVVSILSVGLVTYSIHRPYTQNDYSVQCYYGNKNTFIALKQKGIYIPDLSVGSDGTVGRLPENVRQDLQDACSITDDEINHMLNSMWSDLSSGKMINSDPLWAVRPVSYTVGNTAEAIGLTLISIVILIIIFEVIRLTFFYVVTGSFFPHGRRAYSITSIRLQRKK